MGICDLLDGWDEGPNSAQFGDIRDFVNDLLESWGFDTPQWSDQMPTGYEDSPAVYTSQDNTIHLNPDIFYGDAEDAVNIAVHEGLHAAMHQLDWNLRDAEEEWTAASVGLGVAEDLAEGCKESTESGSPSSMPDYPFISEG
ncbi:hypothetical protein [Saccharothrix sp. NRRL B-16348]|uniref:hypothetical protein n=1 Tax=Saccharothrix sp. NRRL B-16348 TaxID=1415542 RepID=UPI000A5F1DA4|nr:hypothetical protein [Saccharothrix sp. NRRL B-16348]